MRIEQVQKQYYPQVLEIFYETSGIKTFKDLKHKSDFCYKYLSFYYLHYPEYFFIMLDGEDVLGYICGVLNSNECEELFTKVSHYKIFADLYESYPAHLHINCHRLSRGHGVGGKLLNHFVAKIKSDNDCSGVHIITGPEARNVSFYSKHHFSNISVRSFNNSDLLMMGRQFNS